MGAGGGEHHPDCALLPGCRHRVITCYRDFQHGELCFQTEGPGMNELSFPKAAFVMHFTTETREVMKPPFAGQGALPAEREGVECT